MKWKRNTGILLASLMMTGSIDLTIPVRYVRASVALDPPFPDGTRGYNSNTYTDPSPVAKNNWRDGMVTANGEIGVIESGNPTNDVFIYQNTKFNMPNDQLVETPDIHNILSGVRNALMNKNWSQPSSLFMNEASVWKKNNGWDGNWELAYTYSFHPGPQLRLKQTGITAQISPYNRYTNYETAEIGVQYVDTDNAKWTRKTFASRADNVIITYIDKSSNNDTVNLNLSIDPLSQMATEGATPSLDYKSIVPDNAEYIAAVGHYPAIGSQKNGVVVPNWLADGGYAGVTKVIVEGPNASKTKGGTTDSPTLNVTNADSVILITKLGRKTAEMEPITSSGFALVESLLSDINTAVGKYTISGSFNYDNALAPHIAIHKEMFDRVTFDINGDQNDRKLTNEALITKASAETELNRALLERAFFSGRYAYICSSGYQTSRLGGIWTGAWYPQWSGDMTTDANVNLQMAGANIGDTKESSRGYINFILRIVDDWETNAYNIYGIQNAIMAPPRSDGDNGKLFHFNSPFPGQYWNAGASWLLLPIYEYWQCYGDDQIPLAQGVDLDALTSVLDLDDAKKATIRVNGYMDLLNDILLPLMTKMANFWEGFVSDNYVDANNKYILLPGYSPENFPTNTNQYITYNATMDIAAAKDGFKMAKDIYNAAGKGNDPKVAKWDEVASRLPAYMTGTDGSLKEWTTTDLTENQYHRHVSHLYPAWPGYETQNNLLLTNASRDAVDIRNKHNTETAGHGWMHKGLIEARLKRDKGVIDSITPAIKSTMGKYFYSSLMTSHDAGLNAAYCTDTSITIPAIIMESLVYSNTGEIEVLPALTTQWTKGQITNIMARTRAQIEDLEWDLNEGYAIVKIKSDIAQTINIKSGRAASGVSITTLSGTPKEAQIDSSSNSASVNMSAGEEIIVRFDLSFVQGTYSIKNSQAPDNPLAVRDGSCNK